MLTPTSAALESTGACQALEFMAPSTIVLGSSLSYPPSFGASIEQMTPWCSNNAITAYVSAQSVVQEPLVPLFATI
jgi:hypothetical protein